MQKCLIIRLLQTCKDPIYLQFSRLWSNRLGENGLTDACRAVFSELAAPKSHAFLFCHEPLPPGTRCGELCRWLSSRPPGAESLKHRSQPRRVGLRQYRVVRWFLLPEGELPPAAGQAARNYLTATISTGCCLLASSGACWNLTLPKSMALRSMQRMSEFHAVL